MKHEIRHALTVIVVYRLLHKTGLRRGDPQRKARLLQAEVEQLLRPVTHLAGISSAITFKNDQ